ncbi:metal ABC transporter substrate-binding protein [Pseudobutyrivibrio ruminis]|uniref:Zinc ABC transporter substrate-binding protein n=1 Tax=Pseudobutyrivibrio ruminis TaxID=46206 RepID=A0A2G3DXX2_9FIRM|nr:metal ABC transporter substrate-binding protein [Pseudobutyrivibrio ruminis]PHU35791.1 zinc ABC transporter substrate-binding protein [Pseudobutyrivibrio ruminis]
MKKKNLILAVLCICLMLVGCGAKGEVTPADAGKATEAAQVSEDGKTISVVTTIFPEYDWVRQVVGSNSNVEITMLLDNGVDLHSYQPTAEDIMKIASCDLFIYVGGESDEWVEDALAESTNPDMKVINLLETLGDKVQEEEVVEGMEAEEEEEEEGEEGEEEEVEYDEHVWLSLKNAEILVDEIANNLADIDADNVDTYKTNAANYVTELTALDEKYATAVSEGTADTILFGDRFPFRYLVDDYGLNYYAAFVGCSAETEASFETINFLSEKVDELGLKTVLTIENSDQKIAETIISNTKNKDAQILAMDSMQTTTSEDVANGVTYLGVMEENLKVLTEALK